MPRAIKAASVMKVYPVSAFVKVGDTQADIAEVRNTGTWAVSVVVTGNEIGLAEAVWNVLPAGERARRTAEARARFLSWGADYVIDSVADLMPVIDEISLRLARGERPAGV